MQLGYNVKQKATKVASTSRDALILDHVNDTTKPYYIMLIDKFYDQSYIKLLQKELITLGISNYLICSAVKETVLQKTSAEYLVSIKSNYADYKTYKGTYCEALMPFGSALYVVNGNADISWDCFLNTKYVSPRYYSNSEFSNGLDMWTYPVPSLGLVFPLDIAPSNPVCAYTRFFDSQCHFMSTLNNKDFSSVDLRDYNIITVPPFKTDQPLKGKECEEAETAYFKAETSKLLNSLMNSDVLAVDTETSGFSFKFDKLGTIQFCNDGVNGIVLLKKYVDNDLMKKVFDSAKRVVAHNGKFDKHFIEENGCRKWKLTDDTMQLVWIIDSDRPRGLKPNTFLYCGRLGGYDDALDKMKKKLKTQNYLLLPWAVLSKYAGLDPIATWRLLMAAEKLCHQIDNKFINWKEPKMNLWNFYKDIMMPNQEAVTVIEDKGVYWNREAFEDLRKFLEPKIAECAKKLSEAWGVPETFPFTSSTELVKLFKSKGWPAVNGEYSSSDEALTEYERMGYPGIKELKEYRSWNVGMNTYYKGWLENAGWEEETTEWGEKVKVFKTHPKTNCFAVCSYRHAMNEPNLQQIPAGSVLAPYVRKVFATPPSEGLWEADEYNNIEYQKVMTTRGSLYFYELTQEDTILGYDESSKRPIPYTWYKA